MEKYLQQKKKVADFVLQNPQKTVDSNVSEIAKQSGVSDATVVRMCHHIGYTGYYQFRITLARDLGKKQYEGIVIPKSSGANRKTVPRLCREADSDWQENRCRNHVELREPLKNMQCSTYYSNREYLFCFKVYGVPAGKAWNKKYL